MITSRKQLRQRREAWVHNELGVAYEMTGAVGSAMEQYQAGLELASRDLSLRTNLGRTLAWTGDYEAAIEVLRAVAADSDATRRHRETLALIFALGGDIPSAQTVTRLHRLRTLAYADRAPAQALCNKLKRRGVECFVVSTPDHAGLAYEPSEFEKADAPPPPQPSAAATNDRNQRFADAGWPKDFSVF
jgi:tetratricopeptide (TPR) repeat protein